MFNAQDIDSREFGAGFPWTLIISPAERAAFDLIKANPPVDAIVQVEPNVRGAGHWADIPAFAERRMAAGLPISMIPLKPYEDESANVRHGVYRSASAQDAYMVAANLGIDYLVFGRAERKAFPDVLTDIVGHPDLFEAVFQNDAMTLYKVR